MALVQVNTSCNIWGNSTEYRHAPTEEDLTRAPQLVSVPLPGAWPPELQTERKQNKEKIRLALNELTISQGT